MYEKHICYIFTAKVKSEFYTSYYITGSSKNAFAQNIEFCFMQITGMAQAKYSKEKTR